MIYTSTSMEDTYIHDVYQLSIAYKVISVLLLNLCLINQLKLGCFYSMGKDEAQIHFNMNTSSSSSRMDGTDSSVQSQQGILQLKLLLEFCKSNWGVHALCRDQSKPLSVCSEFIKPCQTLRSVLRSHA